VRNGSDVAYLDASALVKLVVDEAESAALRHALGDWPRRATSRLSIVELLRTVRRRDPAGASHARDVLARTALLAVGDRMLMTAALIDPAELRSVDAIHLATALRIRGVLAAFVSYDRRLLEAAATAGLPVVSPS
jgi:predicted nucleic acid-binding protein